MEKDDLYKEERLRGEPMELLIDSMRKQIKVEVHTSRNDITNGFNITYRGRDPKTTQAVASELASKYVHAPTQSTINGGDCANLANRRSELEAELQKLLTQYKEKHPDVVAKKQQLESVKRDQDQMIAEWKTRIEERRQRLVQLTDPRILTLKTQITMVDSDMDRQQKLLNETNQQIADLDARINAIPNAEVGLEASDREYQTKKLNY